MLESTYQAMLIKKLRLLFPGCVVWKNDTSYMQGIPDLTVLYYDKWAVLEVKVRENARVQPNQEFYIHELGHMSFAAFIYPENEEEVLHDLQLAFEPGRDPRVFKR